MRLNFNLFCKKHRKIIIGILFVTFCVLASIYYFYEYKNNDINNSESEAKVTEEKNKEKEEENIKQIDKKATDGKVDENKAKETMRLEIIAEEEILKNMGGEEALKSAVEDFLITNGLWDSTTMAEAKWGIFKDIENHVNVVDFQLNDINKSTLTVNYFIDNKTYEINYH